jgi:hypothetical protein
MVNGQQARAEQREAALQGEREQVLGGTKLGGQVLCPRLRLQQLARSPSTCKYAGTFCSCVPSFKSPFSRCIIRPTVEHPALHPHGSNSDKPGVVVGPNRLDMAWGHEPKSPAIPTAEPLASTLPTTLPPAAEMQAKLSFRCGRC